MYSQNCSEQKPIVKAFSTGTIPNLNNNILEDDVLSELNILRRLCNSKRVLLIGDIVLDKYIYGKCSRLAGDSPAPVFDETSVVYRLGGAANVACNLKAMGISTDFLAVVGEKDTKVIQLLKENNISTDGLVHCPGYHVRVAKRFFQENHQMFRSDKNAHRQVPEEFKQNVLERYKKLLTCNVYNLVIISDYRNGLLTKDVVQTIIGKARESNIATLVDPKMGEYERFVGATYLKPNLQDVRHFIGRDIQTDQDVLKACQTFCQRLQIKTILLTLSEKGIAFYETDRCDANGVHGGVLFGIVPPRLTVKVIDVSGAGDTILAAIAFSICHDFDLEQACHFATKCAGNVIQRPGAISVNMLEVIPQKVIYTQQELESLKSIFPTGTRIAVTTGCFDMLHLGHITALSLAKEQADILIVALNSDVSVKKNKGDSRPIIPLKQRSITLSSLDSVDFIVVFDEDVPHWVMKTIQPDVLVKGSDYTREQMKEIYPYIKTVYFTPPININSTSAIIKKIKEHGTEKCERKKDDSMVG